MPSQPQPQPEPHAADLDAGLLSPARAGTPAEAAVSDGAWLRAMLDAEAALARAQAGLGTLPRSAAETITRVAASGAVDVRTVALSARETANPVVGLVRELTRAVREVDPAAAEYVHRGSTSQDILDTGAMLVARRALCLVHGDLVRTATALAALAKEHRDTLMAGRTLALHAVPTTFGLKAAGWRQLVLDAAHRVDRLLSGGLLAGGLPVSLGGAAGTLAGYLEYAALDGPDAPGARPYEGSSGAGPGYHERLVAAFAAETGLAEQVIPWHALRTPMADLAGVFAFTAGALGKIAVDVQFLARTEVAEVAEPGPSGRGGSSAMPHKRNPVLATLLRSVALQVPGLAAGLAQCLVAEDERSAGAWHAEWQLLRECLRLVGGAAHTAVELAEGLVVRPERMRENVALTGGQLVSERLAAVFAPRLGKAAAKELLARASAEAARTGEPLSRILGKLPETRQWPTDLPSPSELLDPAKYTGSAGELVDRALNR